MKTSLKILIIIALFFCSISVSNAQQTNTKFVDVVYLKNGSIIKGTILSFIVNESVKIETKDGSIYVYSMVDVEKIEKETDTSVPQVNMQSFNRKSPGLAWFFSFLLPGGGQYYNGDYMKGGIMTGVGIASFIGIIATAPASYYSYSSNRYYYEYNSNGQEALNTLFMIAYFGIEIWTMVDAPVRAKQINRQNGLASWNINNKASLSLKPSMNLAINGIPAYGAKIGLKF